MSELEEKLDEYIISFTDKFLYFPCISTLPKSIELRYYLWDFQKGGTKEKNKTLYVACKGKSYLDIATAVCEGLMGYEYKAQNFWNLDRSIRKKLYKIIKS